MRRTLAFGAALAFTFLTLPRTSASDALEFNRDIRPILSENCFHCHGPDADARQAGLRLDIEEDAKEWSIVPGDAESSEVVSRIESTDRDLLMPPPESERSLTAAEKQRIRQWVQQGARYEQHWSFQTPRPTRPPAIDHPRVQSPIDRFIIDRLSREGFQLAPPADKATLIRRLSFDLIGLPPTLEEIDRYVADDSPQATERLIDRLLADPRFGERMASDWLDVARYSDTYGYQVDRDRFVWPYRDWVVAAFNRGLSYDQFLTEQLAGDLLPEASRDQILATTFNRLHPQKVEGGSVPEEFRVEYVADRTQTVGTAFLGLTMECCRCHTHKYDPISQTEYYQLAAFFANIDEAGLYSFFTNSIPTPTLTLPSEEQRVLLDERQAEVRRRAEALRNHIANATAPGAIDRQAAGLFAQPIESLDFEAEPEPPNRSVAGVVGKAVQLTGDDAIKLKHGNFRRDQPFSVSLWLKTPDVKQRAVVFHRSRAWTDAASRGYQLLVEDGHLSWSLIHFWPGNAIRIRAVDPLPLDRWVHVVVSNDGSSSADGLTIAIDGRRVRTETVRDHLTKNITGGGGNEISIGERFRDRGFTGGQVDSFRVFTETLTDLEIRRLSTPEESLPWLEKDAADSLSPSQRAALAEHWIRRVDPETIRLRRQLRQARRNYNEVQDGLDEIMVLRESPGIRTTHRLNRGAYDAPAEAVSADTPQAIGSLDPDARRDRLGLARWMVRPDHPLTSRVAANRLWQLCFGTGLVRTPEDFGSQGEPPTHPRLLDWLALDLVRGDWDIKRAIKQIVMSATYQSASVHPDADVPRRDPENRLLARHPSYRLPAEMLRDQSLAVSQQLIDRLGGPPVKPYEVEASFKPTDRDRGAGLYRRSVYTYWKRTGPAPAMMTLDASKRDVCRVRRERTSSPLQAFVLLNGPQFVEASRATAARLLTEVEDDSERLDRAFRMLTTRRPTTEESQVIAQLYARRLDYFRNHPDRTREFLNVGEMAPPPGIPPAKLAATALVINTLMNYDESVMKR